MYRLRTSTSPWRGAGTGTATSSKSPGLGKPTGRCLRRISRLTVAAMLISFPTTVFPLANHRAFSMSIISGEQPGKETAYGVQCVRYVMVTMTRWLAWTDTEPWKAKRDDDRRFPDRCFSGEGTMMTETERPIAARLMQLMQHLGLE